MANPGDLSSKKVKNTYKRIVQYDGTDHEIYDGTGSRIVDLNVTRITASNASLANIQDLQHLTVSRVQIDTHLSVSGSTFLGDSCADDQVKVHGNTWVSGSLTVSGSCQGTFRSIGQAKFIYLQNPGIEDQKPAKVNRGQDGTGGYHNVPRFGGENAAIDVYGNVVITGSLIVQDTIFAQEIHTEIVSQSIIYTSGSTKFGADFNDTMTVTGSIFQSGSDSFFLNGIGLGTTGSLKPGQYIEPGQANAVEFTHLLRIDDPGHNGLQYKRGKLIYGTFGTRGSVTHVSSSDTVRFRDTNMSEDVLVLSSISQSVFITNQSNIYNVGIGAPSRSLKIDEKLVVSSSKDTRVKIESGTGAKSASLYLESGRSAWEITTVSASTGATNQVSGSLVFRTQNLMNNLNTTAWSGNGTYAEALRLDKTGKAGFNLPSINAYEYPQQVQLSGSLNIIQGRTIDINAGTFHDKDGINGIYFNNQKMIYVSGSGADTSMFFGVQAGGTDAATGGEANIGFGYQSAAAMTTGDYNTLIGYNTGKALTTGGANVFIGKSAGLKTIDGESNIGIGTSAFFNSTGTADYTVAIGYEAMKTGVTTGTDNIAIGRVSLEDATSGHHNISIGHKASLNLTTADNNIAIGEDALGLGIVTGDKNIAIGTDAGKDMTSGTGNVLMGNTAGQNLLAGSYNVALGIGTLDASEAASNQVAIGSNAMGVGVVTGATNVAIGANALADITSGYSNVALGTGAAEELTSGYENVAIGQSALGTGIVTGHYNIALGRQSLEDTTSGNDNIALGRLAAGNLTTGISNIAVGSGSMGLGTVISHDNIAIGNFALEDNTSGGNNIAIGSSSLASATDNIGNIALGFETLKTSANDGDRNIAIGYQTMKTGDVSGADNIAIGSLALEDLSTGASNVAIGTSAALNLTTGESNIAVGNLAIGSGITTGDNNIAIGELTLANLTTGTSNIAVGSSAGDNLTSGIGNVAVGIHALDQEQTYSGNIAIGGHAGYTSTGNLNILIGSGSDTNIAAAGLPAIHNSIALGTNTTVNASNSMVIGNGTVGFKTAIGRIYTPNSTLEVSGSVRITGSLVVSSSNTTTIKGPMFVGEEVATTAWTMAHYGDTDTKWVIDDDDMIFTVGNAQMFRMREDGASSAITVGNSTDIDFVVTSEGTANSLVVEGSTGNTGLGTTTPGEKLEVIGDISASGDIHGDKFISNTKHVADYNGTYLLIGNSTEVPILIGRQGATEINIQGPVTASGNISASGDIFTEAIYMSQGNSTTKTLNINPNSNGVKFGADTHTLQVYGNIRAGLNTTTQHEFNGNISASGNITASGTIITNHVYIPTGGVIEFPDNNFPQYIVSEGAETLKISGSQNFKFDTKDGHLAIKAEPHVSNAGGLTVGGLISGSSGIDLNGYITTTGNITASGNISASGTSHTFGGDITIDDDLYLGGGRHYLSSHGSNTFSIVSGSTGVLTIGANAETAFIGNITASGNISASGAISTRHQILQTVNVTATGNAAANGADLSSIGNQIIIGADGTKAATLPNAATLTVGHTITIHNKAASVLKVFPHAGNAILPLSADGEASVPANTAMIVTVADEDSYVGYFTTVIS